MSKELVLSSGITVTIRPLNPFFGMDVSAALKKKHPAPTPPMQEVDGMDGKKYTQPNEGDPQYLRELSAYNRMINDRAFELALLEAVDVDIDLARLTKFKERYDSLGLECPKDDKLTYITRIAIASADDLLLVRRTVTGMSLPSEDGIREKADELKS